MNKKNSNYGGKREGAGRKPTNTKQLSLKVPIQIINGLNEKYPSVKERNIKIIEVLKRLSK